MKKVWLLTKIQLGGVLNIKKLFNMRQDKKSSKSIILLLALLAVVLFSGMSGIYAYFYSTVLKSMDALEAIPAMWMAATCLLIVFTTIYKVKGTLFQFSDYDMVMSLPASTSAIVASRVLVLYLYDLVFAVIILLPANIVYGVQAGTGVMYYIVSTLLMLLVPLIPIILGTLLGLLVTLASSKFRYSNIVTIVLFIGLFVGYMVVTTKTANTPNMEHILADISGVIMDSIYRIYPFAKFYVHGIVHLSILNIVIFIALSLLIFTLFCYLVGMYFKKINTVLASAKAHSKYRMKELKTSNVRMSLYKKEWKRFIASPMYVMNSSIGSLLGTIFVILYCVGGNKQMEQMTDIPDLVENLPKYIPIFFLFIAMINCTTAASISLEGKNLWILKSLPVKAIDIFIAKAMVNLTVTLPLLLIDLAIFSIKLHMSFLQMFTSVVLGIVGSLFISFFGLCMNLKFPRFDWKSEMEVVKQGVPTFVCVFGGMLVGISPIALIAVVPNVNPCYLFLAFGVILFIITVGIYKYLETKGSIAFSRL